MIPIHVSCADEDRDELQRLSQHLKALPDVTVSSPDSIAPGDLKAAEDKLLEDAKIILLLLSPGYLGSASYQRDWSPIVERYRRGQVKIKPVLLKSVVWNSLKIGDLAFDLLEPLPSDGSFVVDTANRDAQFKQVVEGVQRLIRELTVNGQTAGAVQDVDPITKALTTLVKALKRSNVALFVGSSGEPVGVDVPPRPYEVTRELLSRLGLVERNWEKLLPPLDIAAAYYGVSSSTQLSTDVLDLYRTRSTVPGLHQRLAAFLKVLNTFPDRAPETNGEPQLIITTALDLSMERALFAAGQPFSRVVQHRNAEVMTVNQYGAAELARGADRDKVITSAGRVEVKFDRRNLTVDKTGRAFVEDGPRVEGSNALADLPVNQLQQPVVYKVRGSIDLRDSYALSTDQYIDLVLKATSRSRIPKQITEFVAGNVALFFGFGFLDSEFRLVYSFFREQINNSDATQDRYLVQPPPADEIQDNYRQMERSLWKDLIAFGLQHRKLQTVEISGLEFLKRLSDLLKT